MNLALFAVLVRLQTPDVLEDISKAYSVQVEVKKADFSDKGINYVVTGSAATDKGLEAYKVVFAKEWQLYPVGLMTKAKVKKIVICEKLALSQQVRAAVPAFDLDSMYYDATLGAFSPGYQRSVIHHEFFHMLDQRMGKIRRDTEWAALNPKDFKYGTGGKNMRTPGVGNLTDEIPGFLTRYGTSGAEEDKAELYGHLIVDTKFVMNQAAKDPVLKAKIDLLKKRLEAYDSGFNAEFWAKASEK